jgi:hypothetical protein
LLCHSSAPSEVDSKWVPWALTIVGGGREALVVGRNGTQSKLRARRACDTWSSGPSTSPLEVTMYVRDPAGLAGPSRWANALRLAVNVWVWLFFGSGAAILLLNLFRLQKTPWAVGIVALLVFGTFALAIIAVPGWYAFRLGFVKCPSCGEPFARGMLPLIGANCLNCGYDIQGRTRRGDF